MVYDGQSGCIIGAWNYMVGNFVYGGQPGCMFWCMEVYGGQFSCMEVNPSSMKVKYGEGLVHEIMW